MKEAYIKKIPDAGLFATNVSRFIIEFEDCSSLLVDKELLKVRWFENDKGKTDIVKFHKTKMNLFIYLLEHALQREVTSDELLINVWDKYGLKSSRRQLWYVLGQLKLSLYSLGIPYDFIQTKKGRGYHLEKVKIYLIIDSGTQCSHLDHSR
ncbi:helix-turn-helix domain-containing protein [Enterobacter hormaechei]|uniref:helix-turn-helix domain-containing protein n=1 Tax=Enterobacter hormaechei TaxID=158836 RepID=UPI000735BABA|nr:helix-turn-helix domain-containing protein [Enterobacter hormaechei]KTI04358.1 hypothetical protein ASV12_13575 [Enterobacter hormaechei subsp. xiangfangensis]KTI94301.1 hypothetical protein ASU94_23910 [Enterobacter hormaechei subsp. xiangfangensis]HAS1742911.1 helix-turn-helix domain-containing protein [Enterobacter hormaechei subsp. oharae]HAS1752927.1 helix-turn-helix domain-containing protein [Enterobacter hormaechei subsp. oharae]